MGENGKLIEYLRRTKFSKQNNQNYSISTFYSILDCRTARKYRKENYVRFETEYDKIFCKKLGIVASKVEFPIDPIINELYTLLLNGNLDLYRKQLNEATIRVAKEKPTLHNRFIFEVFSLLDKNRLYKKDELKRLLEIRDIIDCKFEILLEYSILTNTWKYTQCVLKLSTLWNTCNLIDKEDALSQLINNKIKLLINNDHLRF